MSERKRGLKEGGIRVPGVVEYPSSIPKGIRINTPAYTSDYLPTVLDILGSSFPDNRPIDGTSLFSHLSDTSKEKTRSPMVFVFGEKVAVLDGNIKLYRESKNAEFQVFDIQKDPKELQDISGQLSERRNKLIQYWEAWKESQEKSLNGDDYL